MNANPTQHESSEPSSISPKLGSIGSGITILVVLFLAFDGIVKVIQLAPVMEACLKLGMSPGITVGVGLLLLVCTALYAFWRTAVLGAILLTGYLGGAVATHLLQRSGAFAVAFSFAVGVLVWVGLVLRDPRLTRWILLHQ